MKAWLEYHQCQVEAGELDIAGRGVDMTEYSRKSKLSLSNMVGLPQQPLLDNYAKLFQQKPNKDKLNGVDNEKVKVSQLFPTL